MALARGHHHRLRAALDLPLPAMRPVDGRSARVPRHVGICARGVACGVRICVRSARGRRPDRADLVRIAGGLSVWRNDDRAREFPCRHGHHCIRTTGGWHIIRGMARAGRHRRGRRRRHIRLRRVCRMGRTRQSGHAGAAGRAIARHWPCRHRQLRRVAPDCSRDFRGRVRRRRISGTGPLDQRHHTRGVVGLSRVHAAGAVDRALCPHRPSRPLDPVCDPGGDPCRFRSRCSPPARSARWRWR